MPENWETYKLSELASLITKGTTPSTYGFDFIDSGITYIRAQCLNYDGRIDEEAFSYISPDAHEKLKRSQLQPGDILFSMAGAYLGMVGMVKESYCPANTNQAVGIIRISDASLSSKFIEYTLRSPRMISYVNSQSGQSAQPNINLTEIGNLVISAPTLEEQHAIASILSALDDKIELNLQMNKTLEEMVMALYKHWFVDFGPFQNGKFVESELGMIPEGWEVKRLDEVCNLTIGRTPPRKDPKWFSESEGVKWISIKDMGNSGVYILQTSEYLTEEAVKKFNIPIIKPNTVILSFKLTVGRVAISGERMLSNEAIAHLNRKEENIPVEFLYSYLRMFDFNSLGSTSSIATAVNTQTLKAMKITLPANILLSEYANKVVDIFQHIKNNQRENQSLTTLRDTLLPKLISGQIRVKDAEQMLAASL